MAPPSLVFAPKVGHDLGPMRQIGQIRGERDAANFQDFLLVNGIEASVERQSGDVYEVWVLDDEQLDEGAKHLEQFLQAPEDSKYIGHGSSAERIRREEEEADRKARSRMFSSREVMRRRQVSGPPPIMTFTIIAICASVFYLQWKQPQIMDALMMSNRGGSTSLPEVRNGQVWRLVTPIIMHGGPMHIIFNMMWMLTLGSMMERLSGRFYFGLFIIGTAIASNLAQYYWSGPLFLGMSGVVYALFGFIWIKARFDFKSGYGMDRGTVILMLIWLVICMTGWLRIPIANAAHLGGLVAGCLWGFASSYGFPDRFLPGPRK